MHKTTTLKALFLVFGIVVLFFSEQAAAQIVIGTPNLGFSRACASESFNSYKATFVFSPEADLDPTNQFKIEMSDASGSFTTPTVIFSSQPGAVTSSPATLNFNIPTTTSGEGYKIRIKSTGPVASSSSSVAFPAYYKIQDSPFSINNLVATGAFCVGGSYLLTIDNPGTGLNDSPLKYPSLTFKWYKETSPTTSVYVGEGTSLSVSQGGKYFVKTNYGTCTSNSFSNRVTISEIASGVATAPIVSSLGNPFCPGSGMTTLNTISGDSHQWFKDGAAITGATEISYQTDKAGVYSVQVNLGGCSASGTIDLESNGFESSINVGPLTTVEAGETVTVTVTNTATNPEFQWFFNDVLISGAVSATYSASGFGDYRVVVTQSTGCISSKEFIFKIEEAVDPFPEVDKIPNLISPNGDGINDTWVIPTKYVTGTNTEIVIMNNQGKVVLKTKDYLNNWPQDPLNLGSVNQVFYYIISAQGEKVKKGSITVVK